MFLCLLICKKSRILIKEQAYLHFNIKMFLLKNVEKEI